MKHHLRASTGTCMVAAPHKPPASPPIHKSVKGCSQEAFLVPSKMCHMSGGLSFNKIHQACKPVPAGVISTPIDLDTQLLNVHAPRLRVSVKLKSSISITE